ncbi:MAG: hypothetical protein JW904_15260 [Spirochaetales bacterium]|nr:hypothetical protein [Spirochaetales bacterium]
MPGIYSRIINIFQGNRRKAGKADYQDYVLQKLFPKIRYGRDVDLERYIMLRESRQGAAEWGRAYHNLSLRYTDKERAALIHCYRKSQGVFDSVFAKICNQLYKRVSLHLKGRIDQLVSEYKKIETGSQSRGGDASTMGRIDSIVTLCSPDKDSALENVEFLYDFAAHLGYKHQKLKKVVSLVQGYTDGTLFEEATVKESYHFDIREEYRRHRPSKKKKTDGFSLKILITEEDVERIVIPLDGKNEYEQSFAYYERYLPYVDNKEFATKIYVYSKKHSSGHYRIYEAIRKGTQYGHQKGRVFDDVFKIVCSGQYVFNIRSERQVQEKLKSMGLPVPGRRPRQPVQKQPEVKFILPKKREKKITPVPEVITIIAEGIPNVKKELVPAERRPVRQKKEVVPKPERPVPVAENFQDEGRKPASPQAAAKLVKEPEKIQRPVVSHDDLPLISSVNEMVREITTVRKEQKLIVRYFRELLPETLVSMARMSSHDMENEKQGPNSMRELVYYVGRNYERILSAEHERLIHKKRIETMGFSLHLVYSAIMTSFNEVKADFLAGTYSRKKRSMFSKV